MNLNKTIKGCLVGGFAAVSATACATTGGTTQTLDRENCTVYEEDSRGNTRFVGIDTACQGVQQHQLQNNVAAELIVMTFRDTQNAQRRQEMLDRILGALNSDDLQLVSNMNRALSDHNVTREDLRIASTIENCAAQRLDNGRVVYQCR